ncbi:MAG: nucleotidyltransferase domain-containing protein [Nanoarchaeota archaeon]|nr:nucleotidyltransferase domain-containing protein [Nanoarchaeota archaeon]
MSLNSLPLIRNKLKNVLKDKDVYDIILFGSFAKGKAEPNDIDIAVISGKDTKYSIGGFHISRLKPEDFVLNPPSLVNTLLREGYSLKKNRPFCEDYRFIAKAMFAYELKGMAPSAKVMAVNALRGKAGEKGLVEQKGGYWLANQVFAVPVSEENIFERLLLNMGVKFKKMFVLIH